MHGRLGADMATPRRVSPPGRGADWMAWEGNRTPDLSLAPMHWKGPGHRSSRRSVGQAATRRPSGRGRTGRYRRWSGWRSGVVLPRATRSGRSRRGSIGRHRWRSGTAVVPDTVPPRRRSRPEPVPRVRSDTSSRRVPGCVRRWCRSLWRAGRRSTSRSDFAASSRMVSPSRYHSFDPQ
jgi:hypothetical protein